MGGAGDVDVGPGDVVDEVLKLLPQISARHRNLVFFGGQLVFRRIGFEINVKAAAESGLKLSSKLLSLAKRQVECSGS